jgi:hypothetical protein
MDFRIILFNPQKNWQIDRAGLLKSAEKIDGITEKAGKQFSEFVFLN